MKKFVLTITFLFLTSLDLNAQWEILNEGFKGRIQSIDFVNENIGWIAGGNGTLLKTIDGGENWISIQIDDSCNIYQIDFINDSVGWALGSHEILKTNNGGYNWIDVSPYSVDRYYNSIRFSNPDTGVVVGYYKVIINSVLIDKKVIIMRTTNGGSSWDEKVTDKFENITDLQFLNDTTGYFIASLDTNYFLCKTKDLYRTWEVIKQNPYPINSYQFIDKNTAYAIIVDSITQNNIMKSTDEGVSWQNVQSIDIPGLSLDKIYIKRSGVGFIIGHFLTFGRFGWVRTSDAIFLFVEGDKLILQKFAYPCINDVCFINKDNGVMSGGYSSGHGSTGHSFSSSDGGETWNITNGIYDNKSQSIFQSNFFINDIVGFSLARGSIYKTNDCGNSWIQLYQNNNDSTEFYFYGNDICFIDEENGFAVGCDFPTAAILNTTNGGASWDLKWKKINSNFYTELHSISIIGTTCWTVGDAGMILKYTPQSGWKEQTSVTDLPLNKVFFLDENYGWIAGGYQTEDEFHSVLLKTTNRGKTWEINKNLSYFIKDIWFLNNRHGWAVGTNSTYIEYWGDHLYEGVILETKDGGDNWTAVVNNLIGPLNSIYVKNNYAWATGYYGLILRTTNAGITWIDDENNNIYPTEFKLEQNYPNPFNPATKIKYSIPHVETGHAPSLHGVTFKIYDILGREVATLVNEEKSPGNYEAEFNAVETTHRNASLPSGVYFYRLTAGNYTSTKKMVFLK